MINACVSNRKLYCSIRYTKRNLLIVKALRASNIISKFFIYHNQRFTWMKVYLFYFKHKPVCKVLKIISKPSTRFTLSLKALAIVQQKTHASVFVLSTSAGLLPHQDALLRKTSGTLLFVCSL